MVFGIIAVLILAGGALLGESGLLSRRTQSSRLAPSSHSRIAESLLTERLDWFLFAIFVVSHIIFFRGFFTNPGLIAGVLGGNLELKHTFKTIPGVTTWTQVSLLLGTVRGLRWAGVLPGRIKLISWFHLIFFGTLFIRAVLWSERLALIEGGLPFFLCALPRIVRLLGPRAKILIQLFPLIVPVLLLLVFTGFEFLRSWQSNSGDHGNIFEFGYRRLYTYYFEAMNTGAATLGVSGFYDGLTLPLGKMTYEAIYEGLYQGSLDIEFNNASGIWYFATYSGNVLFFPLYFLLGLFYGLVWRSFREGRLFGFFLPINFLGMMEIIRIHYWVGTNRVLPSTLFILLLLVWAATLPGRVKIHRRTEAEITPAEPAPFA